MCVFVCVAFGFCEYKEPESTLRALRLLHEMQVGDKKLLVKVDAKTKAQLDSWKASQRRRNGVNQKSILLFSLDTLFKITSVIELQISIL